MMTCGLKRRVLLLVASVLLSGCVSQGKYNDLQDAIKYTINSDVLFRPGSWQLSPEGREIIAKLAPQLAQFQQTQIVVNGYTDNPPVGRALQQQGITSNQELSQQRAEAVMQYLIAQGVRPDLISARGFGEAGPIASNDTAQGRAQNRRVEVTLAGQTSSGSYVYPVWYGTNRAPVDPQDQKKSYTSQLDSINHYGKCLVVIPKSHEFGSVGSPWYWRWLKGDDQLRMIEVIPLTEDSFLKDIRDTLAKESLFDRSLLVYIHGYDVTFEEAAIRAAQIGFDLKVSGITAFYSWPSQGTLDGYGADYDMIQISEEGLSQFLIKMAKDSNANRVHIVAHSMGNQGLLRALYRSTTQAAITAGVRFGQIFLAAPDVDVDLFKQLADIYPRVAERTTMYVSAKDKALGVSSWLRKDRPRAGYTPPTTTVDGIDTVEATGIDITMLGHSYFAEAAGILYDMHDLLLRNARPELRIRLIKHTTPAGVPYWVIK